jgi:uncharacterized protein
VNSVGVNINTASKHLLSYVSGIGEKLAENIVNYRSENGPFEDQSNSKVPSFGRSFQQGAALFELKRKNPLDNSPFILKPIQLWKKMAKDLKLKVTI